MRFLIVILIFVFFDVLWWVFADRLARRTARPQRWRWIAGVTAGLPLLGLGLLMVAGAIRMRGMIMPEIAVIAVFLWHFLVLPAALLVGAAVIVFGRRKAVITVDYERDAPVVSRRDFLNRGLIVLPPLATVVLTGESKINEDALRLRELHLPIKALPRSLDGMTIAHVTDPHIGSFMSDAKFRRIIEMTNGIDADLILQTGDLINRSLNDLPDGIAMLRQFRARYGVYSCQGNHDCIDDRKVFERDVPRAGLNLLLDEARAVDVRGTKVRLLAPRWWGYHDDVIAWSVNQLAPAATNDAFNILLAHHPHTFDAAAAAGIPLTLAGHSHGGQVGLTQNLGIGRLMYRYWSGPYVKGDSTAVVSNGTGNWFPLRINVPCEIVKITLHCV